MRRYVKPDLFGTLEQYEAAVNEAFARAHREIAEMQCPECHSMLCPAARRRGLPPWVDWPKCSGIGRAIRAEREREGGEHDSDRA